MKAPVLSKSTGMSINSRSGSARVQKSISFNLPEGVTIAGYPSEFAIESTEDGILLSWDDLGTNEDKILIERGLDSASLAGFAVIASDSTSYLDPIAELVDEVEYYYRVTYIRNYSFAQSEVLHESRANLAPTDIDLSVSSIEEGNSIGDVIGVFSTTDADTENTFTYTLTAGTGDTDNASFTITGANLEAAEVFDFATKASYSIRVASTDQGDLTTEKVFEITITEAV